MILDQSIPIRKTPTPVSLASFSSLSGSDQNFSLSSLQGKEAVLSLNQQPEEQSSSGTINKRKYQRRHCQGMTQDTYCNELNLKISGYEIIYLSLRVGNIVPCSYIMMGFFLGCRNFFIIILYKLLEPPNHGFHG